jgi:hypothetical protein
MVFENGFFNVKQQYGGCAICMFRFPIDDGNCWTNGDVHIKLCMEKGKMKYETLFYMLKITNMVLVENLDVISE